MLNTWRELLRQIARKPGREDALHTWFKLNEKDLLPRDKWIERLLRTCQVQVGDVTKCSHVEGWLCLQFLEGGVWAMRVYPCYTHIHPHSLDAYTTPSPCELINARWPFRTRIYIWHHDALLHIHAETTSTKTQPTNWAHSAAQRRVVLPMICSSYRYGVATISRLLKILGLFCRISSLL